MELGKSAKCIVTGFTGTVTAKIEYLYGDTQYLLETPSHDAKEVKSMWVTHNRCSPLE